MFGLLIGGSGRESSEYRISGTVEWVDVRAEGKRAYPLPSFAVRGVTPGKYLKI